MPLCRKMSGNPKESNVVVVSWIMIESILASLVVLVVAFASRSREISWNQ